MTYYNQFVDYMMDKIIQKDPLINLSFVHNGEHQPNSNIVEFIKNSENVDVYQKNSLDKMMYLYHSVMKYEYQSKIYDNSYENTNESSTENSYGKNNISEENTNNDYDNNITYDGYSTVEEIDDYINDKVDEIAKEIVSDMKSKNNNKPSRGKKRDPNTWRKHLKTLIDFMDKNKRAPKYNNKPQSMYIWMLQQKNWSKADYKKKNEDNYDMWVDFVNSYKEYLPTNLIKTIE